MRVLGIDPGVSRCGYGMVERDGDSLSALRAGVMTTDPSDPLPRRLAELARELRSLVAECRPDTVAVERVLFQANARTAMSVGQAAGLALVAAEENSVEVVMYSANEVKQAVAGWGGATKAQMKQMVVALLGLGELPGPADVADALALSICHLRLARGAARLQRATTSRR